ncbi:MAG: bifunctional 4-hydroxy-2-oxoglutarate aldolase/2-dehydro-3-deoxy-phosphogluconate aldolase [Blastocatellia bacterium]
MNHEQVVRTIEAGRIIAILRGDFGGQEQRIVETLCDAGISAVEVTLNSPHVFATIEMLARLADQTDGRLVIGAGTVLTREEARNAAAAGARFIVSPNRDAGVIAETRNLGMASFPGCFTPSEIVEAMQAGATAVKLFPAECLGVPFVRALRGPLPDIRVVPTGGVTPEKAAEYFAAGAWAAGVGSELTGRDRAELATAAGLEKLRQRAAAFAAAARAPQKKHPHAVRKSGFDPPSGKQNNCVICIDTGTTNTRLWLTRGGQALERAGAGVGVRDTAREGSPAKLRQTIKTLIDELRARRPELTPACVVAAGMITSPLGLAEVPHVTAPVSARDLAARVKRLQFPDVTELPVLLVPGVRTAPNKQGPPRDGIIPDIGALDVMRGEETLVVGLQVLGKIRMPGVVLNLGSHWKAISLDLEGRIAGSVTSLSGEMIHATQTQTILASAVPQARPDFIDLFWCEAGLREQKAAGLARALFCVRLLELECAGNAEERLSWLIGAYIGADMTALLRRGILTYGVTVYLTGAPALTGAWEHILTLAGLKAVVIGEADIERGLLVGLHEIAGL